VRGAKPGDVVAIDVIELTPLGVDTSAILWDFGMLRREFLEPMALFSPVHDGRAWFGGPLSAATQSQSLGTVSRCRPKGTSPMPALMAAISTKKTPARVAASSLSPGSGRQRWPSVGR
jgi:hypothetical protein